MSDNRITGIGTFIVKHDIQPITMIKEYSSVLSNIYESVSIKILEIYFCLAFVYRSAYCKAGADRSEPRTDIGIKAMTDCRTFGKTVYTFQFPCFTEIRMQ